MASPNYTTDLTVLDDAADDTDWDEASASGWTSVFAVESGETDYFIQGSACNSTTAKTGVGALLYNNGSGVTIDADGAFLIWFYWTSPNSLDSLANGGIRTVCGNALNAFYGWAHGGKDTYTYGGWLSLATNPAATVPRDYTAGSPTGTWQYFGASFNAVTVPDKGNPFGVDEVSYGRCELRVNGGEAADYATFEGMATENDYNDVVNGYNRWGLFQDVGGSYLWKGLITLGYSSVVDFRDSNRFILIDNTRHVTAAFNKINIEQSGSRVDWTSITIKALGTVSKGSFEAVANADINFEGCNFIDMSTFIFNTNSSVLNSTFQGCAQVTASGADFSGSKVLESTVAADTGALVWNSAADPNTYLDGMTFSMGPNSHHAIDFGTLVTGNIILTNCEFIGFGSTDDSNDSTVRFLAGSGSLTLSLVNCTVDGASATTSNFSVDDAAGITVTLSIDPVTVLVHVVDSGGTDLENARVYLKASDALGDLPFEETVTSITRSGTTVTVTHTAHGLNSNEYVKLEGITDKVEDNRGAHQITWVSADSYTYQTTDSGSTSYTGTIKATGVLIYGLTDSGGDRSASRTFGADQNYEGFVRKSSVSPRFKTFTLGGAINSSAGATINVRMVLDE